MKLYFLSLLLLLTLFNCKNDGNNAADNYAYFGGEIINPNSDYVVLSKSDVVIDSIKLDAKNRFLYKVNDLDAGLYTFYHGGEIQMVLLEPKDSIIFRLNTLEFDESLVFTGEGDKKNNYLINEFLENEIQEKKVFKFCQLKPHVYQNRIDSLKAFKLEKLNAFKTKYPTSELFNRIAKANIDFSYYSSKEVYPFVHFDENKEAILKSLPNNFYNYRSSIDYNDAFFKDHYHYSSFLRYTINNLALKDHLKHSTDNEVFKRSSLCYNMDKLKITDSLVKDGVVKNDLLQYFTINYLSKNKDVENNDVILNAFLSKSTDQKNNTLVKHYVASLNNLKEGASFPSVKLVDYNNNEVEINSLITTPTVVCFWSNTFYNHFKESHYKLNELKTKYPEVKFIVINIDNYGIEKPKHALKENRFKFKDEYQFKTPEASIEALAIQPMTKTIVVDKHQKIVYNNTNIFSINFEEQLLGAINRK
ncbi:TlpA family protein disulfide reductase [Mariniflexile jejuense]|uniref:TlpA family protein disulfide reductase n=1 Tax=Mariniflexile jejuense TaxID=1173582 RepID=A0ABW3JE91_9FLAO